MTSAALNMCPPSSIQNSAYLCLRYFKLLGNVVLGYFSTNFSNFFYLIRSKLRRAVTISNCTAPFLHHIHSIIQMGSKKQMIRAAAKSIVTSVTNQKLFIKRTICKLISHSAGYNMRLPSPAAFCSALFNTKFSVPIPSFGACPNPACFGFINFGPKSLLDGHNGEYIAVGIEMQ